MRAGRRDARLLRRNGKTMSTRHTCAVVYSMKQVMSEKQGDATVYGRLVDGVESLL